jgi:hypothetical protein
LQASAGGGEGVGYTGIPSLFGQSLGGGPASGQGSAQTIGDQGMGANATGDLKGRVNTLFSRVKELDAQLGPA